MLIDFKKVILDLKGDPVKLPDKAELTLLSVCQESLMASFPDEQALPGAEKVKRFVLALKIGDSTLPVEITIEEAAEIKKLVAKAYGPLVVGRAWEILEKAEAK